MNHGYDPETKQQSSQWKSPSSPQPKKPRMSRSSTKTMLIVFFDIHSIVHCKFIPQCAKNWILHNDNAPCHRALLVHEFLINRNMLLLPHPPYLPDLAPANFFLFPKLMMQLKGRHFHTTAEIQRKSQTTTHT
jgi:histone-lysine N-methyltransferase SETMAR